MTDRILEIGKAGLESADQRVRKLMDNMVNSEIPGYKKSDVVVRAFPQALEAASQRAASMLPQVEGSYTTNQAGALAKTGNSLDLAIASNGYFVVAGPWGEGYTRDGRLRVDRDGRLLTVAGNFPILGDNGMIVIPEGAVVSIDADGTVRADDAVIDQLKVVIPEKQNDLLAVTGSFFQKGNNKANLVDDPSPRIVTGYVETSNVSIVEEMMDMISLEKIQALNSKLIQTRDASLAKAMDLGKPNQ
jgi:flagellar basal-body rod protein FlgF